MDFQALLASQGPALLSKLQGAGLNEDQAKAFLPAAEEQVSKAAAGAGIASLLGGGGIDKLLKQVDIGAIAAQVGIDKSLAEKALQSIVPVVMSAMQGGGGSAGLLGGLAGKLFK